MPTSSSFLQRWLEPVVGGWLYADSGLWTVVGFLGAAIFGSRFLLQWLKSEKEKKLVVPWYFWHLSFWGSVLNLLYFLHLDKAPLILGNCFLPFLYGRNILFLRAGGEKGRGRFVFAAVAVLTVLGFGVSALLKDDILIHPRDTHAIEEMTGFDIGLRGYRTEFGKSPTGNAKDIFDNLNGKNEKGIQFFVPRKVSPDGQWLDPWGNPYRLFVSGKSVLIRCAGPNGIFDEGLDEKRDDILWEVSLE